MSPHIFKSSNDGFSESMPFLHAGAGKDSFREHVYQPHVFQQSVTLTATMWNENESTENVENWKFSNWGILTEHSPLWMGLICGFVIVMIVITTVMLWKYCLLSATKKICCRGNYGVMACQMDQNPLPARKDKKESLNGFENFHPLDILPISTNSALQRSVTVGSIPLNSSIMPTTNLEKKPTFDHEENLSRTLNSNSRLEHSQIDVLITRDTCASHISFPKYHLNSDLSKNLSRSTPALEDLYARVNFSKKRKNRMRKGDAAVIAMSKSHSGNNNNSLEQTCSGVVVYNERTAL